MRALEEGGEGGEGGFGESPSKGSVSTLSQPRFFSLESTRPDGFPWVPPPSSGFSTVMELGSWMEEQKRLGNAKAEEAMARLAAATAEAGGGGGGGGHSSALRGLSRKDAEAVGRWMKLADDALPPSTASLWTSLKEGLARYKVAVEKRSASLRECQDLSHANAELKAILARHMATPKAKQLQVHPAYTLRLGPATAGVVSSLAHTALAGETSLPDRRRGTNSSSSSSKLHPSLQLGVTGMGGPSVSSKGPRKAPNLTVQGQRGL